MAKRLYPDLEVLFHLHPQCESSLTSCMARDIPTWQGIATMLQDVKDAATEPAEPAAAAPQAL